MKSHSTIAAVLLTFTLLSSSCSAKDTVIPVNQLPEAARTFISEKLSDYQITYAAKDNDDYEIRLANSWEVEFNKSGEWTDIDCDRNAVPSDIVSLLPAAVTEYISASFQDSFITEIHKERKGFEIELDNGLNLEFNKAGQFKRIDD